MSEAKVCPECGLINPPDVQGCHCGWDFASERQKWPYLSRTKPAPTSREEVESLIRTSKMLAYADRIIGMMQESVRISAVRIPGEDSPVGASRMGGQPDLPIDFPWPTWKAFGLQFCDSDQRIRAENYEDMPLRFLAQINLAELRTFAPCKMLPSKGMLYFFCPWYYLRNMTWEQASLQSNRRVFHLSHDDRPLERRSNPISGYNFDSFPCKVSFLQEWTIPGWDPGNYDFHDKYEECEDGFEVIYSLQDAISPLPFRPDDKERSRHRMFGWPTEINDGLFLASQLAASGFIGEKRPATLQEYELLKEGAKDWRLLLQIDTDEKNPGWMWGDGGTLYFTIHAEDLKTQCFDRVQLIEQS